MKIIRTKKFNFSASYTKADRVIGHNYILSVTTGALSESEEAAVDKKIREVLIKKIDSRDLGLHVDFLKNKDLTDAGLLNAFWGIIQTEIRPVELTALSLECDDHTQLIAVKDF